MILTMYEGLNKKRVEKDKGEMRMNTARGKRDGTTKGLWFRLKIRSEGQDKGHG